jgi:flagellar hook-associated protein 2
VSSTYFSGLVSGLDTTTLIDALVTARTGPIIVLQQRQAQKTSELAAWKAFEGTLVGLKVEADRLASSSLWQTLAVTSSDSDTITATAGASAALGTYEFHVESLAQAHQIRSAEFASSGALVGSGTLTLAVGGAQTEITVAEGTTLAALADQINDSGAPVSAAVLQGQNAEGDTVYHLVLTAQTSGAANEITVTENLSGGTAPDLTTTIRAAADAHVQFGGAGGLDLYSATNTFEDIVDNLDITVHAVSEGTESVSVTVDRDSEGLTSAVATFVSRYNAVISYVNSQFTYDPEVGDRPPLMGNGTLMGIGSALRTRLTETVAGTDGASYRTLYSIGMKAGQAGTLTFDEAAFQAALEDDPTAVAKLFGPGASFDVDGMELLTAPLDVDLAGTSVEIVVTQAATQASLEGDVIDLTSGLTIDDTNDTFQMTINGISSEELTLAHGTYTDGDDLAAAIQAAIENSEELGLLGASVSFEDAGAGTGRFVITGDRYGSNGSLRLGVPSGSFASALGLASQVGTTVTGLDVAGTIGGVEAEGDGQVLTAAEDTEGFAGISFRVALGSGDIPATISANFTEGVGRGLSRELFTLTDTTEGTLARVEGSVQSMIDRIADEIAAKEKQLESYRESLMERYARLESTLAELQNQGNFLSAQIAAYTQSNSWTSTNS